MYNGPFNYLYNRPNVDEINNRIQELERMKAQVQQPTPTSLTQNFSLAPTTNELIRYVNGIEDVQKVFVIGETPYKVIDVAKTFVKKVVLCTTTGHIICVKRGKILDTFDPSQRLVEDVWIVK